MARMVFVAEFNVPETDESGAKLIHAVGEACKAISPAPKRLYVAIKGDADKVLGVFDAERRSSRP